MQNSQHNNISVSISLENFVMCCFSKKKCAYHFGRIVKAKKNREKCYTKKRVSNVGAWIQPRQTKLAHISCFISMKRKKSSINRNASAWVATKFSNLMSIKFISIFCSLLSSSFEINFPIDNQFKRFHRDANTQNQNCKCFAVFMSTANKSNKDYCKTFVFRNDPIQSEEQKLNSPFSLLLHKTNICSARNGTSKKKIGEEFYAEKCIMFPLGITNVIIPCMCDAYRQFLHKSNRHSTDTHMHT